MTEFFLFLLIVAPHPITALLFVISFIGRCYVERW